MTEEEELTTEEKLEIEVVRRDRQRLRGKVKNLQVGFNADLFKGNSHFVTAKYGSAIMRLKRIWDLAKRRAEHENRGINKIFPFLFETNRTLYKEMFHVGDYTARQDFQFFVDSGAFILKDKKHNNVFVYEVGERKRGRREYTYDKMHFNLRNKTTKQFYDEELSSMGIRTRRKQQKVGG